MKAVELDLYLEQWTAFAREFTFTNMDGSPKDLTGATFLAQIRNNTGSGAPVATLVWENGGTTGKVIGSLSVDAIKTIPVKAGSASNRDTTKYVWDMLVTFAGGQPFRLHKGVVEVDPGVSHV